MTPNLSLQKSASLRDYLRVDSLQALYDFFPFEVIDQHVAKGSRDRVYSNENTILTMVYSATQADKTLSNSVSIFENVYNNRKERIIQDATKSMEDEKIKDLESAEIRRGPKKKYKLNLPKSKTGELSNNTAAYSNARKRIKLDLLESIFDKSAEDLNKEYTWYGMKTYLTDGTYVQMQDTDDLRKKYDVKSADGKYVASYPQGLVQTIIKQGSGLIHDFILDSRHVSELSLIYQMIQSIPQGSLLLADDLYNTYAIFSLVRKNKFDIIVPGKRIRNYEVINEIAPGDEIVKLKLTDRPGWLSKDEVLPKELILRRLSFLSPQGDKTLVLYTTILNDKIPKCDIILKYFTRWDIEITIREVKTIMDINVLRGKSDDIVQKEIISAFIAYNLIRKVIMQSVEETAFSPERDLIYEFLENNKELYIDRKGRIYNRWSTGRHAKAEIENC